MWAWALIGLKVCVCVCSCAPLASGRGIKAASRGPLASFPHKHTLICRGNTHTHIYPLIYTHSQLLKLLFLSLWWMLGQPRSRAHRNWGESAVYWQPKGRASIWKMWTDKWTDWFCDCGSAFTFWWLYPAFVSVLFSVHSWIQSRNLTAVSQHWTKIEMCFASAVCYYCGFSPIHWPKRKYKVGLAWFVYVLVSTCPGWRWLTTYLSHIETSFLSSRHPWNRFL